MAIIVVVVVAVIIVVVVALIVVVVVALIVVVCRNWCNNTGRTAASDNHSDKCPSCLGS